MTKAETKTTGEVSPGMDDFALITPWMACVACWRQMFDLDENTNEDWPSSGAPDYLALAPVRARRG